MRKPKEPTKPRQPNKPNQYLTPQKRSISIHTGMTLAAILAELSMHMKDVNPEKIRFDATCGYYDDYDYELQWTEEPRSNPRYEKDMYEYEIKMSKYRKDMVIYNSSLKEYNSLNKQYLKWFHENELKKLG